MNEVSIFLEIILKSEDFKFDGRDAVEDPLDDALADLGIGEVTGGGAGMGFSNIDVEVTDLDIGLQVIRETLSSLGVAESTVIKQYEPVIREYSVY